MPLESKSAASSAQRVLVQDGRKYGPISTEGTWTALARRSSYARGCKHAFAPFLLTALIIGFSFLPTGTSSALVQRERIIEQTAPSEPPSPAKEIIADKTPASQPAVTKEQVVDQLKTKMATTAPVDASPSAKIARELFDDIVQERQQYATAMANLGLTDILKPAHLLDADAYPDSRKRCTAAYDILRRYEVEMQSILDGVPGRLRAEGMSEKEIAEFMVGYDKTSAESKEAFHKLISLEREAINQFVALLDYTEPRIGKQISVVNGQVRYANAEDAMVFVRSALHFKQIAKQEADLKQMANEKARQAMDQFTETADAR